MFWREHFTVPWQIFEDSALFPLDKIVFAALAKNPDFPNKKLAQFLNVSSRHIVRSKTNLAKHGYAEKVSLGSGIREVKYVLIDPAVKAIRKIALYLKHGQIFNENSITLKTLNSLQSKDAEKLLIVISMLEWQYLNSDKTVDFPERLLIKKFKEGVTPPPTWKEGWLEARLERKESAKIKKADEEKGRSQLRMERVMRKAFENYLKTAKPREIKALRKAAEKQVNGAAPEVREMLVKIEMQKVWEDKNGNLQYSH